MRVAIVGAGPAGYYVAEGLLNLHAGVQVDILERLPTPYGLVRAGVAPDHQSTKSVIRRFAKLHEMSGVRFFGNIQVGLDIRIEELKALYDAVVIATGAPRDRKLNISGESLAGVYGASRFVGWYNAHPAEYALDPDLETRAAIVIGNGNVAIDVARVLAKTPEEMSSSDLAAHACVIHSSPLREISIIGRRGPLQVGFTPKEFGELGQLAAAVTTADLRQLPPPEAKARVNPALQRVLQMLEGYAANVAEPARKHINIEFFARPVRILGRNRVTGVQFERTTIEDGVCNGTGEFFERACGLVVTCIGYRIEPIEGTASDAARGVLQNVDKLIEPGLYCVGWCSRGSSGTIGSNRNEGFELAKRIAAGAAHPGKLGGAGLAAIAARRGIELVTFDAWRKIDAAEIAAAPRGAPRRKFPTTAQMLGVLHKSCPPEAVGSSPAAMKSKIAD